MPSAHSRQVLLSITRCWPAPHARNVMPVVVVVVVVSMTAVAVVVVMGVSVA